MTQAGPLTLTPSTSLAPASGWLAQIVTLVLLAGVGLLVVEQTVERTLRECSRACVMEGGRIVLAGDSATLAADDRIGAIVMGGATPT